MKLTSAFTSLLFWPLFIWAQHPIATEVASNAQASVERFSNDAAEWEVNIQFPSNPNSFRVAVLRDRDRIRYIGSIAATNEDPIVIFKVIAETNVWYVVEEEIRLKCRPWKHYFQFAISELLMEASELRFVCDATALTPYVAGETNSTSVRFRERMDLSQSNNLAAVLKESDSVSPTSTNSQRTSTQSPADFLKRTLRDGRSFSINHRYGFQDEWETQQLNVKVRNFRWLPESSTNRIQYDIKNWPDRTQPYRGANWDRCVFVVHDPAADSRDKARISPRLGILRIDTGTVTRIPVPALSTIWGCFLPSRQEALVLHQDIFGEAQVSKVNLRTGDVNPCDFALAGQPIGMPILSPDHKTIAILYRPSTAESVLEFQMLLLDLETQKASPLGKAGKLGGPYSWLPDGSGIILKRFNPAPPNEIEPCTVCILKLDGTMTDIVAGDDPLVIPSQKRFLFEGANREWFLCDLAGKIRVKYAGGMKGYGNPTLAPNGKEMLWVRYSSDQFPQINLFDFGSNKGKAVVKSPGFTSIPVW